MSHYLGEGIVFIVQNLYINLYHYA